MAFPLPPEVSKGRIDDAGEILASSKNTSKKYKESLLIVNAWRSCHAYPINTFVTTLRKKTNKYDDPIVAQRLKRLQTIKDKLKRYPSMRLSRMQDIGGVRAVVNSIDEVRELQREYSSEIKFTHKLVNQKDYISSPKKDGYRGIHLVYRYDNKLARNKQAKKYEGLLIELQLRTKLQHTWATAVETMGTFKGEELKSQKGSKEWLDFFSLMSSAIAIIEDTPLLDQHLSLSRQALCKKIAALERKLNVIHTMQGLTLAAKAINQNKVQRGAYHLIILRPAEFKVSISSYNSHQLDVAAKQYAAIEARAVAGENVEAVLVSVNKLKSLKAAYPNYFFDIQDFTEKVQAVIETIEEIEYKS